MRPFNQPPKPPCYAYWVKQQGNTVRVTKGALAGLVGRLNGVNYEYGEVVYRTGCRMHAEHRSVWITYEDLEVVGGHSTHIDECYHQPCCCHADYTEAERKAAKAVDFARAYGAEMCPSGGPIRHILGHGLTCSACIRHRNAKQTLPCGCPSDHYHGRPRPRQYCLERGCRQCHLVVPEHWHASNDGTVRQ